MKNKRRHNSSSEDSEPSMESISSSTSDSDGESSRELKQKSKKRKKQAQSSESESDSDEQYKKSKKRKHKKKKKRHSKKKRRDVSDEESDSEESSGSAEAVSHKKRKHKHKSHKHKNTRSDEEYSEENGEVHHIKSVIKDKRDSSEDDRQPTRTYYQKEYKLSPSMEGYQDRQYEVQRFYRGSSKDHSRNNFEHTYNYRDHNNKREEQFRERRPIGEGEYSHRRPQADGQFRRNFQGGGNRGFQHGGDRGSRRPDGTGREFYARRDQQHPREKEYPDRRQFQDHYDRGRDMRRDRPERNERPPPPQHREFVDPLNKRDKGDNRRFEDRRVKDESNFGEKREDYKDKREDYKDRREDYKDRREDYKDRREDFKDRREDYKDKKEDFKERLPKKFDDKNKYERGRNDRGDRFERNSSRDNKNERISERRDEERSPKRDRKSRFTEADGKEYSWGKTEVKQEGKDKSEKEKPNFGLSGKLTADANTVNGIVIKYTEPDDAKQPKRRWRFYPFKGDKPLPILYIHRQSCFVLGREKKIADIHLEHPSVSKQHAALQFRAVPFTRDNGTQGRRVRPYIIDLESANGTFVNNKKIEARRYVELMERDVVKFGFSQRDYVLLHENSKDENDDDDNENDDPVAVTTTEQIKREKRAKEIAVADGE